jgi:hypothetical protein
MNKEFVIALNDYCKDHFKHFQCCPIEFEYNDKVYQWEEYQHLIKFDELTR